MGEKKELLTVSEFAKAAGVSKQAVYSQLETRLKQFRVKLNNRTMIEKRALNEFYFNQVEQPIQPKVNQVEQPKTEDEKDQNELYETLKLTIETLREQLEAKDRQLEAKDKQLEGLTAALRAAQETAQAAQALHGANILQIEQAKEATGEKTAGQSEGVTDPGEIKPHWWEFWKR